MKVVGEIMQELGFHKNSAKSAQEAFLRHLIKVSSGVEADIVSSKTPIKSAAKSEQLSFTLNEDSVLKTAI